MPSPEGMPDDPTYLLAALVDYETEMAQHVTEALRQLAYLLDRRAATGMWSSDEIDEAQFRASLLNAYAPGRIWLEIPRRES